MPKNKKENETQVYRYCDMELNTIQDFKNATKDIIYNYCIDHGISEDDIPPQIWNDILDELKYTLFRPNKRFFWNPEGVSCEYDAQKVVDTYDMIYKRICNQHRKEVTQKGFCDMFDIDKQTIYNLGNPNKRLNALPFDFNQKIMKDNEQSLEAMLQDKSMNPMKVLPSLNRKHQWNMPGVRQSEDRKNMQALPDLSAGTIQKGRVFGTSPECIVQNDDGSNTP